MKLHKTDILGTGTVALDPVGDRDIVPKSYLERKLAGEISITNIEPVVNSGNNIVGLKEYLTDVIPANHYLKEVTTNVAAVRIHFTAQPNAGDRAVTVVAKHNAIESVPTEVVADINNIDLHPNDARTFVGYVDITLDDAKIIDTITLVSSTGQEFSVVVNILVGGPVVDTLTIGALPNGQTALKLNDVVPVTGSIDNTAVSVKVLNYSVSKSEHALILGAEDSAGAGKRTVTGNVTASSRSGAGQVVRIVGTNLLGTETDPAFDSTNTVTLDQTKPSIGNANYAYPAGQEAIKNSESVDVTVTITNADVYAYSTDAGLSVNSPAGYAATKTVSRVDETIQYSINAELYTIVATRTSNGAVTTKNFDINVVNVPAVAALTIVGNPSRLRSSVAGETYYVQVAPSQPLIEAPASLDLAPNAGTFEGNGLASGQNFRYKFKVTDVHARGVHTFTNLSIKGLSGIVATTISSGETYEIGGFTAREITMPALQQFTDMGVSVRDFSKMRAMYVGADELTRTTSLDQLVKGFSIVNSGGAHDANGDHIFITDANFAGSNTSGTLKIEVEELA